MNKRVTEIIVGLFLLAGIAAVAFLAFRVGNMGVGGVGETYRISASFENIGGLNVKAPVTLAGVRVGRVSAISVDRDAYSAVVYMDIYAEYDNLPKDTAASILTAGLLGAQYIGLDPGGDFEFLEEGDELDITQSAMVLENLIGQFLFSQGEKE